MSGSNGTETSDNLGSTLDDIKRVLTLKLPPFLESRNGTCSSGLSGVSCKVLNCDVTLLDLLNLAHKPTSVLCRAEIEIEERTREENGQESNKVVTKESLVVKKMMGNQKSQDIQDFKHLFNTESKMVGDITPLLLSTSTGKSVRSKVSSLFPKCYFASRKSTDLMIVLEDVQSKGFKIGGNKSLLMDFDHIVLALEGLARFHALSYALKRQDPQAFYSRVVQKIRRGKKFGREQKAIGQMYAHAYFQSLQFAALQPLEIYATRHVNGDTKLNTSVKRLSELLEDTAGIIRRVLIPKEPLSVLCHGNFNMRNILFQYDSNNKPVHTKFIDFQNVYYASPAIDLSFFLFLNTSPELRAKHWNDFFLVYHSTLVNTLSELMGCAIEELLPEYSLEAFKEDFSKHAIYGYILTAGHVISALSQQCEIYKVFEMLNNSAPSTDDMNKCITENLKLEGEEITHRLVSLIKEMLHEGYIS